MEDFEFSVEISDCDWECFFNECEECNLLSPALAGVDDSGLSDISSGSRRSKGPRPAECAYGLDPTAAATPLDDSMATIHHGSRLSILSDSEEDIHLRSVNMFFERMAGGMQSKVNPEEEQTSGSKQKITIQGLPVPGNNSAAHSGILPLPVGQTTAQWDMTPQLKGAHQENALTDTCNPDSQSSHEMIVQVKRRDDVSSEESQIKAQDWSPSASFKRKRRKKRRLNFEPDDRKVFFKRSDSEEEQYTFRPEAKLLPAPITPQPGSLNICHHPALCGNKDLHDFKSPRHHTNVHPTKTLDSAAAYLTENIDGKSCPEYETVDTSTSAPSVLATTPTHVPFLDIGQNDNLSSGKSVVAVKVANAGNQQLTLCDIDSEQLEPDGHNKDQDSPPVRKATPLLEEGLILDVNLSATTRETVCKCNVLSEIRELIEPKETRSQSSSPPAVVNITNDNPIPDDVETSSLAVLCCYTEGLQTEHSVFDANNPHVSLSSPTTVCHVDSMRPGSCKMEGESVSVPQLQESVIGGLNNEEGDSKYNCDSKDSKPTVFAMSSFWREMEKLTINDILGLRMVNRGAQHDHPEHEGSESELFVEQDGFKSPAQDYDLQEVESHPIKSVTWEDEPITMSLGNGLYCPSSAIEDVFDPVVSESSHNCSKKMSKAVSVQNLPALESLSDPHKKGHLHGTQEEVRGGVQSNQDDAIKGITSSSVESYKVSLTSILQYFFGKKPPISSQAVVETTNFTAATSLAESYDLFFSEFDTEHFFFPLMKSDDTRMVPIYSRSRPSTMQFPEVYESLFASSSSDDSSSEEEDESIRQPFRVITRWSHQPSQTSTDIYDHFFSDGDVRQNFFWGSGLSFRNLRWRGSTAEKQLSLSSITMSGRSRKRMSFPPNILGNGHVVHPDPLLLHLEDRINSQLMKPFRHEKLLPSNPRLDAPLLPLRQSDMCLICIAFASWVLKTANPQVGDTWKAVLLANISALSAIRYLRKYMKVETRDTNKMLHVTESSESISL
ncbi:PGC-1 and ERR-induced regulator in muscle protein 1 [Synchiropus splendidus]|uniref:PGC-1 and ERR-induced regulator in muscle protein 1 n=1 Tax=Synchiropus splendidus TaxID=270530 RepID=UPI00237D855C|nr:PGC-1 and ERR-induced regulator in muscle protein 1 [Synchiropus splendidus]